MAGGNVQKGPVVGVACRTRVVTHRAGASLGSRDAMINP